MTRDPWVRTVGWQAGVLGLAWRVGALDQRLLTVQRHAALCQSQLLLPPVAVLVNGAGPCDERRVEERAELAWRALAARASGMPRTVVPWVDAYRWTCGGCEQGCEQGCEW